MQTGSQKPQGVRRGRGEQKRNRAGQGWSFSLPHATLPSPQGPNSGGVAGSDGVGSPQSLSKLQPPAAPYTGAGRGQARRGPSSRAPLPAPLRRKKALGVALIPPEAKAREAKASPFPGGGRGNPLEGPWAVRLTFLRLTDPSREASARGKYMPPAARNGHADPFPASPTSPRRREGGGGASSQNNGFVSGLLLLLVSGGRALPSLIPLPPPAPPTLTSRHIPSRSSVAGARPLNSARPRLSLLALLGIRTERRAPLGSTDSSPPPVSRPGSGPAHSLPRSRWGRGPGHVLSSAADWSWQFCVSRIFF